MRRSGRMRWSLTVAAVVLGITAAAAGSAGAASGSTVKFPFPDPSLSGSGSVDLTPLLHTPALAGRRWFSYSPTPSGAVWVGATSPNCVASDCTMSYLSRLNSDGHLVRTLGKDGSLKYTDETQAKSTIVSDLAGRAVTVTSGTGGEITVQRFLPSGAKDKSFGKGGTTTVNCNCLAEATEQIGVSFDGKGRIVIGVSTYSGFPDPGLVSIARLLPDGSLDPGFGAKGIVLSTGQTDAQFVSPGGAVFILGHRGKRGELAALERFTNRGAPDTAYDSRADRALVEAQQSGPDAAVGFHIAGVRFRKRGVVDVILSSFKGSTVVRLRSNGSPETKFGKAGMKTLAPTIVQALPAGDGATLATVESAATPGELELARYLPNFRLDRSFGNGGTYPIRFISRGEEISIAAASKGRVTVVNPGLRVCRSACEPEPELLRFRVGKAK